MKVSLTSPKLLFRFALLVAVSMFLLVNKDLFLQIFEADLGPLKIYQLFFFFLVAEMAIVLFPGSNKRIGCGKLFSKHYYKAADYSHEAVNRVSRKLHRQALVVLILWILLISNLGLLYKFKVIKDSGLYFISLVFYFLDQLFVSTWCPFQALIMRNKCCNTCRIYNWGHFMMFSPLVFIPNIYAQTLFWISVVILLQWEYQYLRHPERFSEISNMKLRCTSCSSGCTRKTGQALRTTRTLPDNNQH